MPSVSRKLLPVDTSRPCTANTTPVANRVFGRCSNKDSADPTAPCPPALLVAPVQCRRASKAVACLRALAQACVRVDPALVPALVRESASVRPPVHVRALAQACVQVARALAAPMPVVRFRHVAVRCASRPDSADNKTTTPETTAFGPFFQIQDSRILESGKPVRPPMTSPKQCVCHASTTSSAAWRTDASSRRLPARQ